MEPKGKCFAETCEECHWWRQRQMESLIDGKPTGIKEMRWVCEFETLLNAMHYHMGSLDGVQQAANEARNRAMETKLRIEDFGSAVISVVSKIDKLKLK